MQALSEELQAAGVAVEFMAVNKADAVENQEVLAAQADFPMIQDSDELTAWAKMDGGKDDFFLYNATAPWPFICPRGTVATALMTEVGYANLRAAATALK